MTTNLEVVAAINAELSSTPPYYKFKIFRRTKEGDLWRLIVEDVEDTKGLGENLEGSVAKWFDPTVGAADVLSTIPENNEIILRYCTTTPPGKEEDIFIFPPRYLQAIRDIWLDSAWADRCFDWLDHLLVGGEYTGNNVPSTDGFPTLRMRQSKAFNLLGYRASFLWGPPGTGKTYTLGALLAKYISQFSNTRVLLLSTTNSATDIALVSVDDALKNLTGVNGYSTVRKQCKRIGSRFIASNYVGREHLLPVRDEGLIKRCISLEAKKPDKEDVQAYYRWKSAMDAVRKEIRKQAIDMINRARIVAMTTTRAAFTLRDLMCMNFDLIVFDEASQVSIAYALAFSPMAKYILYAGDPKQLAPIVRASRHDGAKYWLGKSMFKYMGKTSPFVCLLNEQSRMAEPICSLVSKLFYDGELFVAKDKHYDTNWLSERHNEYLPSVGDTHLYIQKISTQGTWSNSFRGPIRYDSAVYIKNLVYELASSIDEKDILVLTPFRAQRSLIRKMLRSEGFNKVDVSTVHKAQGRQRNTVLFDAVDECSKFLNEDFNEDAPRLINVAISRAKARLILLIGVGSESNPIFAKILYLYVCQQDIREGKHINDFIDDGIISKSAKNEKVIIGNKVGIIIEIAHNYETFKIIECSTGRILEYIVSHIK